MTDVVKLEEHKARARANAAHSAFELWSASGAVRLRIVVEASSATATVSVGDEEPVVAEFDRASLANFMERALAAVEPEIVADTELYDGDD